MSYLYLIVDYVSPMSIGTLCCHRLPLSIEPTQTRNSHGWPHQRSGALLRSISEHPEVARGITPPRESSGKPPISRPIPADSSQNEAKSRFDDLSDQGFRQSRAELFLSGTTPVLLDSRRLLSPHLRLTAFLVKFARRHPFMRGSTRSGRPMPWSSKALVPELDTLFTAMSNIELFFMGEMLQTSSPTLFIVKHSKLPKRPATPAFFAFGKAAKSSSKAVILDVRIMLLMACGNALQRASSIDLGIPCIERYTKPPQEHLDVAEMIFGVAPVLG